MSLEPINPIETINNTSKSLEFQKILVDKNLFNSLDESDDIKPLDIKEIDKRNMKTSKAGLRKAKFESQNQSNILSIRNKLSNKLLKLPKENETFKNANINNSDSQTKAIIVRAFKTETRVINGILSYIAYYPDNLMVVTTGLSDPVQYCYRNNILYASSNTLCYEIVNGKRYSVFYYPDQKMKIYSQVLNTFEESQFI